MSDAELRALEKDGSLAPAAWQEVIDELNRRKQTAPRPGAPAPSVRVAAEAAAAAPPTTSALSSSATAHDDDPRLGQAVQHLEALLVPGETLVAYAVQRRLFALVHRRVLVAATSGRLIRIERGIFGGYSPIDMRWQDIESAHLRVGIFGADLTITSRGRQDLASSGQASGVVAVLGLRKSEAEKVYRAAQAQEQSWREKRRVRDLDELRAKSGGIQLGAGGLGSAGAGSGGAAGDDPLARLQRAKEMLAGGLITDSEYESIKAKIVDRM
ncbi:MAG TPA: PH domain-containing protein [Gemmatimonadaceae bacterium]|nr:PH domain-containing protein [Gemmatimonadaceae bacterium]